MLSILRKICRWMMRRCGANIARANDVILAEAAVFALAKAMPRAKAEELVKTACAIAMSEGRPLIEVVKETSDASGGHSRLGSSVKSGELSG